MGEVAQEPLPGHVRSLVVGGGFGGIAMAVRLLQDGVRDLLVLERADEVGGTWRDNAYPGCACDVQSTLYALSFAPKPDWSRVYAPQAEIWAYLRDVVDRFGVRPYLRLDTELSAAAWDEDAQLWRAETSRGPVTADVLVLATGALCEPRYPSVPGLDSFAGPSWHSSRWRHDVDLSGLHVGVVGTGASSVQLVPPVAEQAAHLTVFQRTPPWVLPRGDHPVSRRRAAAYARMPVLQRLSRTGLRLQHELLLANFRSLRVSALTARYGRRLLGRSVADPRLRAALTPDYAPGCKRVLLSDDYLPALQRPDVDVVSEAVTEVVPTGVVTADGRTHRLDALVLATGFHVTDQPVAGVVTGRDGRSLAEVWQGSPRAHLGTTVAGFPNLFLLLGPNTGLGHSSVLLMLEAQVRLVRQAVRLLADTGAASLEPSAEAQRAWNDRVDARMRRTVWVAGGCSSWYLDETGRNSTLWPGTTYSFQRALARLDPGDYLLRHRSADRPPPGAGHDSAVRTGASAVRPGGRGGRTTTTGPARALTRLGAAAWYGLARTALDLPEPTVRRVTRGNPSPPDGVVVEPSMAMVVAAQRWEGRRRLAEPRDVALARRRMRRNTVGLQGRPTPVASVRDLTIPGEVDIPARHYAPPSRTTRPLLVFFHGGGFTLGDLDTHDEPCRVLCRQADLHVLSIGYRLAPEHPFPAGLADAQAAYAWARTHATELRADPDVVCVGGDSAGANLATVVCQLARAAGVETPTAQLLLYPPTDRFGDYASRRQYGTGYLLTEDDVEWFHQAYVGSLDRTQDPRRSPLLATNLGEQPPALVVTAELDPLRDEGSAYVAALQAAGVRVHHRLARGMLHGFFSMTTISRAARAEALQISLDFRRLLDDLGGLP